MAINPADDYLIHQTPYTFDTVFTSDRNFYDRYFFNGYRRDAEVFFALAFGTYPNLGVMDAAFNVVRNGKQRVVRGSRRLSGDRMDTTVGPISVRILEPLKSLSVKVDGGEWGVSADLVFTARALADEEPHFFRRAAGVVVMDYTRVTQHGTWSGTITIDGQEFAVQDRDWWGCRDHSWGIRGVGGPDTRGAPGGQAPQFYWNWAPLNFEDMGTLYTMSEYSDGTAWHKSGVILTRYPDATRTEAEPGHSLVYAPGTRWIGSGAKISLTPHEGDPLEITFEPLYHFLMRGLGYGEPKWGHGMWVGEHEVDWLEHDLSKVNPMENLHVQTVSSVRAGDREGTGVFEIIVIGPHAPSGFTAIMDPAP
jgi:hypothetical protein